MMCGFVTTQPILLSGGSQTQPVVASFATFGWIIVKRSSSSTL
jgi:hypothetical protein